MELFVISNKLFEQLIKNSSCKKETKLLMHKLNFPEEFNSFNNYYKSNFIQIKFHTLKYKGSFIIVLELAKHHSKVFGL